MIARLQGKLVEKTGQSLLIDVQGVCYEVSVPASVLNRIEGTVDDDGRIRLITYEYLQMEQSRALPVLIGFLNEIERDFFLQFITVSGIGPRAAVRALNKPIADIAHAIDEGDIDFLKTLPGIGMQRAREIVAKLQGKIGKYGLIQDRSPTTAASSGTMPDWQDEALTVLLQLQYKKQEAVEMIRKALERSGNIKSAEELLNEIYRQRVKHE